MTYEILCDVCGFDLDDCQCTQFNEALCQVDWYIESRNISAEERLDDAAITAIRFELEDMKEAEKEINPDFDAEFGQCLFDVTLDHKRRATPDFCEPKFTDAFLEW